MSDSPTTSIVARESEQHLYIRSKMSAFEKYAAAHKPENLHGPGDSRPTALEIVRDNNLEGLWKDKVVLITGCSSGIGIPTAEALSATGAKIYAAVRNVEKGRAAVQHLFESGRIEFLELRLDSLKSIRDCAASFQERESKLNILINNAGVMAVPELVRTEDGFESQVATNYLGPFLLFQLLKPQLLAGSTPEFHSRVVNVSSTGHRIHAPDLDDINLEKPGAYSPWAAYGASKTGILWMANEIERRYGSGNPQAMSSGKAVHGNSVMPGGISTGLQLHTPGFIEMISQNPEVGKYIKSADQGAATSVWAAVDSVWEGKGGKWLEDCQIGQAADPTIPALEGSPGFATWAFDEENATKLWDLSSPLVGINA